MEETIYKLDSKGNIRFLTIQTLDNLIIQTSGILNSPNTVKHESECTAKNIGKTNETTPKQQAILEANAKVKAKLEEGYYKTIEEAHSKVLILPMLAKDFKEQESKVIYPCYVQPKLDGMRALKDGSSIISRKNKAITTVNHIADEFRSLYTMFDGELYTHGISFQENMKLVKKYVKGETEKIKYHIYDIVNLSLSFKLRYILLKTLFDKFQPKNCELVPTYLINSKEELLEKHKKFLEQGYEGTIVRHGEVGYESNKRSSSLLKFKDFQDLACEIIDVEPSEKRPTHGSFVCKLSDGRIFGCGMRFSHSEREDILKNSENYIGKMAEIRFFEYTDEGLPRFPVCVGIRLDK